MLNVVLSCLFQLLDVFKSKNVVDYLARKNVKLFEMISLKWKTLKELILVLEIPYNATIALQNSRITLSDVFGIWTKMKLHIQACAAKESYKTKLSQNFVESLNARHAAIFNYPEMECCLFLDPRFRNVIVRDRGAVERVKENLIRLWNHLNSLIAPNSTSHASNESSDLHVSFDEQAELNKLLAPDNTSDMSIDIAIDLFQPDSLSIEKSVLDYWDTQRNSPLYNVAMALFSIPPTQAQIERDFSSLSHIFTDRRYRLSQNRLEEILLIHFNKDFFFEIKKEMISKA